MRRVHMPLAILLPFVFMAMGAATVLVSASNAQASQFKRINDVNVSCNDALRCDLFITNPRVTLYTFGFRRAAAFDAPIAWYLTLREPLSIGSDVRFTVDGAEVLTLPASAFSYRAAISEYAFDDQAIVRALFAAAKPGERLQVTYRTRAGQATAPFSLIGIVEGAAFMDEVQGRVGRADALSAIGDAGPLPEVPGGGAVVQLDVLPAGLRRYYEGRGAPCAGFDGLPPDPLGGFEAGIDDELRLVALRCGGGGAYNLPFALWERVDDDYRRLALPVMTDQGPGADLLAWNASWDQEGRELTALFKGRGLGDCGVFSRWQLTVGDDATGFVLREMRVKDACDGVFDETMESWDQLWPPISDKS